MKLKKNEFLVHSPTDCKYKFGIYDLNFAGIDNVYLNDTLYKD